jgi:hypothetical protein
MITICLLSTIMFAFQEAEPTITPAHDREWRTPAEIDAQLMQLDVQEAAVIVSTIGYSNSGQPIRCIQVAREGETPIDARSAVLVVAGVDGDMLLGTEVATDLVTTLLQMEPDATSSLLETHKLFIIPQVNPDAAQYYFHSVKNGQRRTVTPVDDDHDGVKDEDSNEDLNGDGFITMMRVPDLEKALFIADPDEPRLHITPEPLDGQSPAFILYSEGIDNDEDGKYNEDGTGGVDLNKNFMHGYQYHGDGAGAWQLSENESKALAEFVLQHQEIAFILVYGQHDTLSKPFSENGNDFAGAPKNLAKGDVDLYKRISEKFVEITELTNVEQSSWNGSFVAWAYAQFGVPAFSTPLWTRPEQEKVESAAEITEVKQGEDQPSGEEASRRPSMRGGFDRQAMMDEFDADGDGELDDKEREKFRDSMQAQHGGRRDGGQRGTRGGPPRSESKNNTPSDDSGLTPSGIGDISQETIDDLMAAAETKGYPVSEEMMEDITPEDIEKFAKMSGVEIRRVKSKQDSTSPSGVEQKWLDYSDNQRDGEGFVEWTSFEHPQLGTVEIGGWVPYFKSLPPTNFIQSTTENQAKFIIEMASDLPKVRLTTPSIKKLSNGLWEVTVAVMNDGWLPTGTAMAKKNKRARPLVLRLDVPNKTILSGKKVNLLWSLNGEGTKEWYKWTIQGNTNEKINLILFNEKYGNSTITFPLKETKGSDA